MIARRATAPLIAALLASGCTMTPKYERPQGAVPAAFPTGEAYPAPTNETLPAIDRAAIFTDARLLQLMDQALANNRDLRVAAANILQARAQFRIQRAQLFPEVDASGQVSRTENGNGGSTTVSANLSVPSWELDLFGRIRSLSDAAQQRYFASEAAARATRLALLSDIADAWLTYAADRSLLTLAQSTMDSANQSASLAEARLKGGVASRTDFALAQTILANAQSDLARQKTLVAQDVNLLALLVGAPVDAALLPGDIEQAGATVTDPPTATSSEILLRRPDVLAAEYDLRAANADIGAARAALFPRITLAGLIGLASGSLESLFGNAGQSVLQGSGAATYPIFQAGAGRANLAATRAQHDAVLATYEKAIQTAFREVADALARRGTIDEQIAADVRGTAAAGDALRLSEARYRGGIDSFLVNLDSQRSYYAAQKALVASRLEAASNRVALLPDAGRRCAHSGAGRAEGELSPTAKKSPFVLNVSKGVLLSERKERGFDKLSPNGNESGSGFSRKPRRRLPDQRDHVGQPLGAVGGELALEVERRQRALDVERRDLRRHAVLHGQQHQRDNALGDRGIAVGEEMERAVRAAGGIDPDLGRAAAHQSRIGLERVRHRLQLATEVDEQAIALVALEQVVIIPDGLEGRSHGAPYRGRGGGGNEARRSDSAPFLNQTPFALSVVEGLKRGT